MWNEAGAERREYRQRDTQRESPNVTPGGQECPEGVRPRPKNPRESLPACKQNKATQALTKKQHFVLCHASLLGGRTIQGFFPVQRNQI